MIMKKSTKPLLERQRVQQKFNQKETFKKYGKEIVIQDYIEENLDSVDIKSALEKYGAIPPERINEEVVYQDLTGINDLRSISDKRRQIEELFYSLPPSVRKEFNNNVMTFEENGLAYFEKKHQINVERARRYMEQMKQQKAKKDGGKPDDTKE